MTKPLGYYTGYTPGNKGVLADIQIAYGSNLEGLNPAEKLFLISMISTELCITAATASPVGSDVYNWMPRIREELSFSDREGIIECLIANSRT